MHHNDCVSISSSLNRPCLSYVPCDVSERLKLNQSEEYKIIYKLCNLEYKGWLGSHLSLPYIRITGELFKKHRYQDPTPGNTNLKSLG